MLPALKHLMIALFMSASGVSFAQTHAQLNQFNDFVIRNYHLPEDLKYNCEWMYAVVRLTGDTQNRVKSIEILNDAPQAFKDGFKFLKDYKFAKNIAISKHPIVFYFAIDNKEICKANPGDKIFYSPNEVVGITVNYIQRILKDDPKTIIMPNLLIKSFYQQQIKQSD